ncbi:MAG: uroporphyrinogen-III C-methyltransferase [Cellvibrionales bacterium]|nr:uroporphyrinogen-III C-methyltransferase [Cellvibrionales bacterium]
MENKALESEAQVEKPADGAAAKKLRPARRRRGGWLVVGFLVLLLGAFGGGGYLAWYYLGEQAAEREARFGAELSRLGTHIAELRQQNAALASGQQAMQQSLVAAVADGEAQLLALAQRLAASESHTEADWTLAEAHYLLRFANQRLATHADTATALRLLAQTDDILRQLGYPELAPVRRQLARDRARLHSAQSVDLAGIFFELEAVGLALAELEPFAPESLAPEPSESPAPEPVKAGRWAQFQKRAEQILNRYIRVERGAGGPVYLASRDEQVARRLAIGLQIRQAQLALLGGHQNVFKRALDAAAEALVLAYPREPAAQSLQARLGSLTELQLVEPALDIGDSLRALEAAMAQRGGRDDAAAGGAQNGSGGD